MGSLITYTSESSCDLIACNFLFENNRFAMSIGISGSRLDTYTRRIATVFALWYSCTVPRTARNLVSANREHRYLVAGVRNITLTRWTRNHRWEHAERFILLTVKNDFFIYVKYVSHKPSTGHIVYEKRIITVILFLLLYTIVIYLHVIFYGDFNCYILAATSEGSIPMYDGEELYMIELDQGDGWTRVRRISQPIEGFVPTSYIECHLYNT